MADAVSLEFPRCGLAQYEVSLDAGVDDLASDVFVGESNDEAIFRCVVLCLVLGDKTFASIVVCPALPPAAILDLVPGKVRVVLDEFVVGLERILLALGSGK